AASESPAPTVTASGPSGEADITSYLNEQYALSGHNGQSGVVRSELPANLAARYSRVWYLDASASYTQKTKLLFTFNEAPGAAAGYVLLNRAGTSGNFTALTAAAAVDGNNVIFANLTMKDGSYYTLGTKDETASPLGTLSGITSAEGPDFTYDLKNAWPNPFNPQTTIAYSLARNSAVRLTVYNQLGQAVATLVDGKREEAGHHQVIWDARSMPSGLYFFRLEAGAFIKTGKMVLIK
ncbi:MAG TPA: T9SS type A sorting domain-containing protein, partial [bacterium]|nr:T9SS type A sorting domain-containing protein [bacterium]